jgi:hypothetical protein
MTGNILYYSLGGGLGHLSRTFAILNNSPKIIEQVRILASSKLSYLVSKCSPCPMDNVPDGVMNDRTLYFKFLQNYIETHSISVIILDTFPFGMFGEINFIDERMPRILIGRYLNWEKYQQRVSEAQNIFPVKSLIIEPQEKIYFNLMKEKSQIDYIDKPIILRDIIDNKVIIKDRFLIIHSGTDDEIEKLVKNAKSKMIEFGYKENNYDLITPENNIFPAYSLIRSYKYIVSAAGYNMCGIAAELSQDRKAFLYPFKRKFDDQFFRKEKLDSGMWQSGNYYGEIDAGSWLEKIILEM